MKYCYHIWAGAPSCYLGLLDNLQKPICRAVGPSLAVSFEPLAHLQNVASLSLLYKVQINFSKLSHERLYEKNLGAIMIEPDRQKILYAANCWKMHFPIKLKVFRDT